MLYHRTTKGFMRTLPIKKKCEKRICTNSEVENKRVKTTKMTLKCTSTNIDNKNVLFFNVLGSRPKSLSKI